MTEESYQNDGSETYTQALCILNNEVLYQIPPKNGIWNDKHAFHTYVKNIAFSVLDLNMNTMILEAFLYGLYTGIVVVTLWAVSSSPRRLHSIFLYIIIVTLYVLSTIPFAINWAFERRAFIKHGQQLLLRFRSVGRLQPVAESILPCQWYYWWHKCAYCRYDYYVAMLGALGSPMASNSRTNGLCCSGDRHEDPTNTK
ncbi:hypothetical protein F5146DRAFT_181039 [Armillaria mellea]|nr:hypothetical protein F5146DRAFT_181039 [Armillaria mellea]